MITKQQHYFSGEEVHAGDKVRFTGLSGVIVFVNDTSEYLPGFTAEECNYMGSGFMVRLESGELIFLKEADQDLELVHTL